MSGGERPDPEPDEEDRERGARIGDKRRGRSSRGQSRSSQTEQTEEQEQSQQSQQMDDGGDSGMSQTPQTEQTTQGEQSEETAEEPDSLGVKDRRHDTWYLYEPLADELDLAHDELNLAMRREYGKGAKLEKNRHFRPLVLRLGMEALEEMSPEDVRETLDEDDLLDNPPEA